MYAYYLLATRETRLIAALIDTFWFGIPYMLVVIGNAKKASELIVISYLVIFVLFGIQVYLLTTTGQSIGKKIMNIRIVRRDTQQNGGFVTNLLLRGLVNGLLGIIPLYGLVDILFIFRPNRRCIHDAIANTIVVKA